MFVLSKRNIVLPAPDGSVSVRLARDALCSVPEWAADTPYFKMLVADGKIVPSSKSDKSVQAAAEKKIRARRGREITED